MTPSCLESNLAALRRWLPHMADLLAATAIPPAWQLTTGTDSTPTYCRYDQAGTRLDWLGGTSMPAASAAALVASMDPGGTNGIGLGMGTGYEWRAFLERLTAAQALYVLEPDPVLACLALSICPLSAALDCGQLLLFTGPDAAAEMAEFCAAHGGYEPPTVLHPLPTLPPGRRNGLLSLGEQMVRQAVTAHGQRTAAAVAQLQALPVPVDAQRRLILALGQGGPLDRSLRGAMAALAQRHPGKIAELFIDQHATASLLQRVQAALDQAPALIVSDLFRPQLGPCVPPHVPVETWVPAIPPLSFWFNISGLAQADGGDRVVCHCAAHQELLQEAGAAQVRIVPVALPADLIPPVGESHGLAIRHAVALLGDLPSLDPEVHGLKLPSHAAVWNAARDLILEDPLAIHGGMLPDLLRRAQARAGVELVDAELAASIGRGIRHVLAVSGVAIGLARLLVEAGLTVRCIGSGWDIPETQGLALQITPMPPTRAALATLWSQAALLLHYNAAGVVHPLVLHAACSDVALVAPEHPRAGDPGGLATLLAPGRACLNPTRHKTVQAVKDLLRDGTRRQALADTARATIVAEHTWARRMGSATG